MKPKDFDDLAWAALALCWLIVAVAVLILVIGKVASGQWCS